MKRRATPITTIPAGHMVAQLEKLMEETAAGALPLRERASMRANDPDRKSNGRFSAVASLPNQTVNCVIIPESSCSRM